MDAPAKPDAAAQIAAALDWWREAGVDAAFHDEPACWFAPEEKAPLPATTAPAAREAAAPDCPAPIVDRAAWPADLAAFRAWWLAEPALDGGRLSGRVPPRGPAAAELMIIVAEPERDVGERLLAGPQGRLLDAMLAAMGVAPDAAYVASVLPRHTPMADWAEVERGFAGLLRHHVALVTPRRLLVLGANILPLLGNDPAHSPAVSRSFNHDGLSIALLAGKSLAALLERPRWKAGLWLGWLEWTRQQ